MPLITNWQDNFRAAIVPATGGNTTITITDAGQTVANFTTPKPSGCIGFKGTVTTVPPGESVSIAKYTVGDGDRITIGFGPDGTTDDNFTEALDDITSATFHQDFTLSTQTGVLGFINDGQWTVPFFY